jgi:hypothetical protein
MGEHLRRKWAALTNFTKDLRGWSGSLKKTFSRDSTHAEFSFGEGGSRLLRNGLGTNAEPLFMELVVCYRRIAG